MTDGRTNRTRTLPGFSQTVAPAVTYNSAEVIFERESPACRDGASPTVCKSRLSYVWKQLYSWSVSGHKRMSRCLLSWQVLKFPSQRREICLTTLAAHVAVRSARTAQFPFVKVREDIRCQGLKSTPATLPFARNPQPRQFPTPTLPEVTGLRISPTRHTL